MSEPLHSPDPSSAADAVADARVLVVEDDPQVADVLRRVLTGAGQIVDHAANVADGIGLARDREYGVIVLDMELPDGSGMEVIGAVRTAGQSTPIIVLTGLALDEHVVRALDAGADDSLVKPVANSVLLARVRAAMRRATSPLGQRLTAGDVTVDRLTRRVEAEGREIPLTPREFALLEFLMLRRGEVLSREELLAHVWKMDFDPGSNLVDVQVTRLRHKLARAPRAPRIATVRGRGFTLTAD
jgi:DNA-binding response OmpR family regulator